MRLFVAILLSDAMKDALVAAQSAWFDHGVRGNYASVENLHLTLAFIGEYPSIEPVMDALETVSFEPFSLILEGMGCFGDLWWAGLRRSEPLEAVVRRVRRALADVDIPFDRKRFAPHITLLRRATGRAPVTRPQAVSMAVDAISLMRSDRGRDGMIYTEVGSVIAD